MLKKLSIIALLALVVIPAGVFAAGNGIGGAGSGTMAAGGQQSDAGQVAGQYSYTNQNQINADAGNGTLIRNRACEQLQTQNQLQSQLQSQLKTQSQNQLMVQASAESGSGSGDQLQTQNQTRIRQQLCTLTCEQLQNMTRIQSRLMDGSGGNCPRLATTV